MFERQKLDAEMRRLQRVKQKNPPATGTVGAEVVSFFKQSVEKRHTKFGQIADCWCRLVPEALQEHCALESLARGTLTVLVDSAAHLYDLKQLLLAGLEQQLLLACKTAGLRKVTLKPGRWYDEAEGGTRPRF